MAWIKIDHTMPDKPEVAAIADRLGIDLDAVSGKLLRLWIWCDQQTVDGNALRVTAAYLDRLTNCPGFSAALIGVGWLKDRNGALSIHNFARHNGQTAKARALTSSRVKRSRNGASVTPALPEKRREEKKKETPLPPGLDSPDFRAAWSDWRRHRSEIKKPLRPTQEAKQLQMLELLGLSRAVAMIEYTIAKGWQGLREPEEAGFQADDPAREQPASTVNTFAPRRNS